MQTLAQDVGGLKRVLSNVKTRGNIGEIQLSMLLEQLLAPEQYEANVKPGKARTRWSNLPSSCRVKTNSPIVFTYPSMPSSRRICMNNCSMHTIQPTRNKSKQPGRIWKQLSGRWRKIFQTNTWIRRLRPNSELCFCLSKEYMPKWFAGRPCWKICSAIIMSLLQVRLR